MGDRWAGCDVGRAHESDDSTCQGPGRVVCWARIEPSALGGGLRAVARIGRGRGKWSGSHESALLWVLLGLSGMFAWQNPSFLTWGNAADLINSHCFLALLAVGLFVVLVTGGIDISFTATAAVAQYMTMWCLVSWGGVETYGQRG